MHTSMNSATETISGKTKGNGKCGDEFPAAARSATCIRDAGGAKDRGCVLFKKCLTNSPNVWKTHPTKYCRKYNNNSTTKQFDFDNGRNSAPFNGNKKECICQP